MREATSLIVASLFYPLLSHAVSLETKVDKTSLRINCSALREYTQIAGAASGTVEDQINARIRREMTVGKKLREEDCPEETSSESFEYHNSAKATSQREAKIGIDYQVYFPGGVGRLYRKCDLYDLKNGHEINLKRCLNESVQSLIESRACASSKIFCQGGLKTIEYCWDDGGVKALVPLDGNWRSTQVAEILLKKIELKALLKPDCPLR